MDISAELVGDAAGHVAFSTLERSESLAKVELDVITLAFHTDTHQQTALRVKVEPVLTRHVVVEM